MKSVTSPFLLSLLLLATPALSESGVPSFAELDANQDGMISRDEARADERVAASFADVDQDRDGYLSPEEFAAKWH